MRKETIGGFGVSCATRKPLRLALLFLLLLWIFAQSPHARVSGRPSSVAQPAPQHQSATAQGTQAATTLEAGKAIEREISSGQTQSYQISLPAGQFASVTIQQRGIDVVERLLSPGGKLIAEFDSEWRPQEAEGAEFVAETAGVYRLDVKAKIKGESGGYEIHVTELRAPTAQDRLLHEAHRLSTEAAALDGAGRFEEARALAERALDAAEKALVPDHIYVAYLLNRLGLIQRSKGEYAKAEASLQRALTVNEKALGLEHPQTVDSLMGLGLVYRSLGDFVKAGRLLQQALEITERTLGSEHPRVVSCLLSLDVFHSVLGDEAQSERELQRALAIARKTLEPDDLLMSKVLNNLGDHYRTKKEYERAEAFLQQALAIKEKTLGAEHPLVADSLQNLGIVARERKDYARALELYRRALSIREKMLGAEHPHVAALLNNIANIYHAQGDYAKALETQERVLSLALKSFRPYHGLPLTALGNIARTYAAQGDIAHAVAFQTRAEENMETALALDLAIGSERQKLAYIDSLGQRTDRTISLHANLAPNDQAACALATLVLLQRKGRVLDAMSASLSALRQRFNAEDQKLLDELNSTTAQLAKLALDGPQKLSPDEYQKQLTALEEQKERREEAISQRSAEFRAQSQPITLSSVQGAIPRSAALIEFAIYHPFDPRAQNNSEAYGKAHYIAYLVRASGDVQWKELGAAQEIDAAIGQFRQALRDSQRKDVRDLARAVDERVMRPIRALLGDTTQLLISPDGELHLLPFAALVDEEGRYLIQRYSFTYLTSGRDLLRMQVARESKRQPLVIADPTFGEPLKELLAKTASTGNQTALEGRRRSVTTGSDLAEVYFAPLGGTAQEANTILKLFPGASLLTGAQATESAVKKIAAPGLLHIATHGFFLQDDEMAAPGKSQAAAVPVKAKAWVANPLLRSGLALAGANSRHEDGSDDGILTALEASGLNLWGTKLIVLSACDTGLGEVRSGEGVYGLRRSFVLAGAESLVMSLWPVSDYSTRELMVSYYRNLKQGMGRGAGLRQVQLDMLKRNRQLHPFYWANFIQSGDWSSLDGKR
jgi:CHAT domain-containing protein/Tfp pilus assembly protein PilF